MGLEIRTVEHLDGARAVAELFDVVWEQPAGNPMVRPELVRALSVSGAYVAVAELDGRVVGGSIGWLGTEQGTLALHSHITGVLPDAQAGGIGLALKRHQRRWCLERGVPAVHWTFDPLVRRNAWFNLQRLGAGIERYEVDFYGRLDDGINAGDESDRAVIVWEVGSERATAAAEGRLPEPELGGRTEYVLCPTPPDIEGLRRTDPGAARRWRHELRQQLAPALAAGGRVVGFSRDGCYVVTTEDGR